jgi:ABC-2 type transport system ATP-binding protein
MSDEIAIKVDKVGKVFRLPHEKNNSVKSAVLNFYRQSRTFEKQQVLSDISFEIKKGEFFGIVGRNGSGKSTLLKMLAGIYSPSEGTIEVRGRLTPFIELGVGFNPELTGRENVFLNGALLGFNRKEMHTMYDQIVEFAELERFMDQKLKNYSSGMQVRLAFSIAIRAKSDILLIDEVLAVGDIAFQKKCIDYFKQLKKDKQTVVLVSHDMTTVEKHCDRALLIHNGVTQASGNPKEIAAKYRLLNLPPKESEPERQTLKLFGDVTIDKVTVNGSDEAVVKETGELSVDIFYTPKKTKRFIVAISIVSSDGSHVAYYDTRADHKITGKKGQACQVTCRFKADHFLEGAYRINVDLYDDDLIYLANKTDAVQFSVMDTGPAKAGRLNLQGKWTVKKSKS